ncbi:putative orfan [Tupanvirus soda lake]|uniref:Orfan n=1 Tax=Tupanvirus deep ocean TaxID=2126984 RepID=A0A2K9L320_9VIRU|nr:putative orfan [Tupanvirus soda lake]AUL77604.2 putative orfan [Tupanvirus soda lake]
MWKVYFVNSDNHWNNRDGPEHDWEAASIIIHESIDFTDLDKLTWSKDILYAHGAAGVFPYDDYGNSKKLNHPEIINKNQEFLDILNDMYIQNNFNDKYFMFDNGISFYENEARPRPYIYGKNSDGKVVCVFLHSLF